MLLSLTNNFSKILKSNNNISISLSFFSTVEVCNTDFSYLFVSKILRSFNLINKVYLKNSFIKFIKDFFIWKDLDKMLNNNIISILGTSIYKSKENFGRSSLSSFLLNLYLTEFDFLVEKILFNYNFFRNFDLRWQISNNKFLYYLILYAPFIPLKSETMFFKLSKLKFLTLIKYDTLYKFFLNFFSNNYYYALYLSYVRHLDFFLLRIYGSKFFVTFLKKKLQKILLFEVHFNIQKLSIFNSIEKNIIFLGYKILFCRNDTSLNFNGIRINKFYFTKTIFRIIKNQKIFCQTFLKRLKFEFTINLKHLIIENLNLSYLSTDFWSLIFQLEAINSMRFNKLSLVNSIKDYTSNNILSEIKSATTYIYSKYFFSLYNFKIHFVFQNIVRNFTSVIFNVVLSNDFFFLSYLLELKKNIILQNNKYFFNSFYLNNKFSSSNFLYFFSRKFYTKNIMFMKKKFLNFNSFFMSSYLKKNFFYLSVPFSLLILKLKLLGFLHPSNNSAVGNLSLVFFSDDFIIRISSYLVYSILSWFSLCNNFKELRYFVELIRESCLLTLCRKHNKNRYWIYTVYTFDFLSLKNLYRDNFYFPNIKFILHLDKKRFFFKKNFQVDESFFLSD